jgi:hypothetical protein
VRLLGQVAGDDAEDARRPRVPLAEDPEAAEHVRVHARPAEVLAHPVDDEHVDVVDR